jgi:hypothetical protein
MNDGMRYDLDSPGDGPTAHNYVALPLEKYEVERQKPNDPDVWAKYTAEMDKYILQVGDEKIQFVMEDQDLRQFSEDDRALMQKIIAAQIAEGGPQGPANRLPNLFEYDNAPVEPQFAPAAYSSKLRPLLNINTQTSGTYRVEKMNGKDHIVVPVVALIEGVIQGVTADNPELALASEFGRFPASWNGRPVTIDHPYVLSSGGSEGDASSDSNGAATASDVVRVSASSSPEILQDFQVGFVFGTHLKEGTKPKLMMEVWLDPVKMSKHSEASRALLAKIKRGEQVEVSTGLFTGVEPQSGEFDGKQYDGIWRGVVPDHLALLPEGLTGACSIEDGCGVHQNTTASKKVLQPLQLSPAMEPTSPFAAPKPDPSDTPAPYFTTPPTPPCPCGGTCENCQSNIAVGSNDVPSTVGMMKVKGNESMSTPAARANCAPTTNTAAAAENPKTFSAEQFIRDHLIPKGMMHDDARSLLQNALTTGMADRYPYVVGHTNDHVVYSAYDSNNGGSRKTYQRGHKIDSKSKGVSFDDDEQEVALTTQITPLSDGSNSADNNFMQVSTAPPPMSYQQRKATATATADPGTTQPMERQMTNPTSSASPKQVTAAEARTFLQDFVYDPAGLATAADDVVLKLHTKVIASLAKHTPEPVKANEATATTAAPTAGITKAPTAEEYLAAAPAGVREALESGMRMHAQKKTQLIERLTANTRCKFTKEALANMDISMLENLAELSIVPDYSGLAPAGSSAAMHAHSTGGDTGGTDDPWAAAPPPRLGIVNNGAPAKPDKAAA